jgi:integrase
VEASAVRAAGLEHRSPYALPHTYATFAIAAGVSLFELARFMGTSVEQIDRTCGHLLPDSLSGHGGRSTRLRAKRTLSPWQTGEPRPISVH